MGSKEEGKDEIKGDGNEMFKEYVWCNYIEIGLVMRKLGED